MKKLKLVKKVMFEINNNGTIKVITKNLFFGRTIKTENFNSTYKENFFSFLVENYFFN